MADRVLTESYLFAIARDQEDGRITDVLVRVEAVGANNMHVTATIEYLLIPD